MQRLELVSKVMKKGRLRWSVRVECEDTDKMLYTTGRRIQHDGRMQAKLTYFLKAINVSVQTLGEVTFC